MRRLPHCAASDQYPGTLSADGRRPSIPTTVGMLWAFLSAEVSSPLRMSSSRTARSVSSPRPAHSPGRPASLRVHSGQPSVACPSRASVAMPADSVDVPVPKTVAVLSLRSKYSDGASHRRKCSPRSTPFGDEPCRTSTPVLCPRTPPPQHTHPGRCALGIPERRRAAFSAQEGSPPGPIRPVTSPRSAHSGSWARNPEGSLRSTLGGLLPRARRHLCIASALSLWSEC